MVWFGLVWFKVHSFSHTCNIGHINYSLQFIYYNTTYNIWTSTQNNIINNNSKFKNQLEVESITTSRYIYIYLYLYTYIYIHIHMYIQIKSDNIEWYWVILHVGLFRCLLLIWLHWPKISTGIPSKIFLQQVKWIYKEETF